MSRKKRVDPQEEGIKVRVTGPGCSFADRRILPGETATVPSELAAEWIQSGRALAVSAEDTRDG